MAAKQGTLAQLSAQAEDAKRAVLSKAGASSWFSNLNTVCTIKSAPPRTPEVLQMLATKSGWLYKRNEQHVWQARWCCIVPHTFLYYFDAPAGTTILSNGTSSGGGNFPNSQPGPQQQEEWNHAVQYGLGDRKPHEKRSHFPLFHGSTTTATTPATHALDDDLNNSNDNNSGTVPPNAQNLPPAGIIDLECYTTIHRSSENEAVLQLAGDDQVNPDLRAFYFCSADGTNGGPGDVEEWSHAILNNRHSSLQDEVDAFKYVADSFAERLDLLYAELNEAKTQQEESEQVLYRVRSAAEGTSRTVYRTVDECWDRTLTVLSSSAIDFNTLSLNDKRIEFRQNLESIRQQDLGIPATVRLLSDYVAIVEDACMGLQHIVNQLQSDVQKSDQTDQAELLELQEASEEAAKQHRIEKEQLLQELAAAQAVSQITTKELKDVQKDLSSTKMEITMLLSQQRTKNITLLQVKKKLKAEVLDLRQKLVAIVSENTTLQHECDKLKMQLEQERTNNSMLKNYMSKVESQVQVQQNMMEIMSQAGGGSVYGGMSVNMNPMNANRSVASHNDFIHNTTNNNYRMDRHTATINDDNDGEDEFDMNENIMMDDRDVIDDDFENDERMLMQPPNIPVSPAIQGRRRRMPQSQGSQYRRTNSFMSDNDIDNKSHVSELTEDRTQREFAAFQHNQHHITHHLSQNQQQPYSPQGVYANDGFQSGARIRKRLQENILATSPRPIINGPPSVIVGVTKNDIHSSNNKEGGNRNLDTINNSGSVRSLPVNGNLGSTPPIYCSKIGNLMDSPTRDTGRTEATSVTSGGQSTTTESVTKCSIAQQSRMEAEKKSTPVRVRLDEKSLSSLQRKTSEANLKALANIGVIPNSATSTPSRINTTTDHRKQNGQQNGSPQHSQGSGLWRLVETAVLGPRSDDDDDDDDESYDSEGSTRVTDMTDDIHGGGAGDSAKRRFAAGSRESRDVDEKKCSDSVVSFSNLSLQERSLIQREKQIQFLREQGLIKTANDIRGGAGSAIDTASVTSSNAGMSTATSSSMLKKMIAPR